MTPLYLLGWSALSGSLLTAWGVRPFRFLFLDADMVMSALRCRRLGIDVFATNPCDALGRLYDYSPLWLHAAVLPWTEAWIVPAGIVVVAAFVLALLLLPPGRDWWRTGLIVSGVLATPTAFALERANNDVIIFALAGAMAALMCGRPAWRAVGYGCAVLAGLLKYYPLALMALAARERPGRFWALAAGACAVVAIFVAWEYQPLRRALALIPTGSYFGDMFGARTLPFGLAELAGWPVGAARLFELLLDLGAIGAATLISARGRVADDLRRLSEPERVFLLAGALLVLGCFLTAQNIGYRAIHLILVLPAMTALAGRGRRGWTISLVILLVVLWSDGWRHWLDALVEQRPPWASLPIAMDGPRFLGWLLREACWWWVATLLWTVALALLRDAATARWLLRLRAQGGVTAPGPAPPNPAAYRQSPGRAP